MLSINQIVCDYSWTQLTGVSVQFMKCYSKSQNSPERVKEAFLIIPGNPGCIQFYETFAIQLVKQTGIPVWGLSHTGHACQSDNSNNAAHPTRIDCGLQNQIAHKVEFIKSVLFNHTEKVILVGHSIGSYVILHIMDQMKEHSSRLILGILLFPTIEQMAITPNGKIFTPVLKYARWILTFAAALLYCLPKSVSDFLISSYVKSCDSNVLTAVSRNLIHPSVVDSVTYMALQEMLGVLKREDSIISPLMNSLFFYYGASDQWCLPHFHEDIKEQFSEMRNRVKLCQKGVPHAFVLNHSVEIADEVVTIVKDMLKV